MKVNVRIFRDIDELKIWGNEFGFRFHRDPEDKTKYRVLLTDDDVDKLETFVRQQQAEIEALKEALTEGGVVCARCGAIAFDPVITQKAKTLTDEEITAVSKEIFKDYKNFHHYQIDFARAILRKAQEK
jgi:hypothetical protein